MYLTVQGVGIFCNPSQCYPSLRFKESHSACLLPKHWQRGVPVVQPNSGGFPEVVEATGGGVIYDAQNENGLTDALESLLLDPDSVQKYADHGRNVVMEQFGIERMAKDMVKVYTSLV